MATRIGMFNINRNLETKLLGSTYAGFVACMPPMNLVNSPYYDEDVGKKT